MHVYIVKYRRLDTWDTHVLMETNGLSNVFVLSDPEPSAISILG